MRRALLLCAVLATAAQVGSADPPAVEEGPHQVARRLVAAAREGSAAPVPQRGAKPDRMAVLEALLTEEIGGADPRPALAALAAGLAADDPAADVARGWSRATPQALADERARALLLVALESLLVGPGTDGPQQVLARAEAGLPPDPPSSLAGSRLGLLRLIALQRLGRFQESEEPATTLATQAVSRGWDDLAERAFSLQGLAFRRLRRPHAADAYVAAADAARRLGDEAREVGALQLAVVLLHNTDRARELRTTAARMLEVLGPSADAQTRIGLEVWRAHAEVDLGHLGLAAASLTASLAEAEREGLAIPTRLALTELMNVRAVQGRMDEALDLADRLLAMPAPHGLPGREKAPWIGVAGALARLGLYERALRVAQEALDDFVRAGDAAAEPAAEAHRAVADALGGLGKRAQAREHLEQAAAFYRSRSRDLLLAQTLASLGDLDLAEGNLEAAQAKGAEALARSEGGVARHRHRVHAMRAGVALAARDPAAALVEINRALALSLEGDPQPIRDARLVRVQATALLDLGRPAEALTALRAAADLCLRVTGGLGDRDATGLREAARELASAGQRAARALRRLEPARAEEALRAAWWFREAGQALLLAEDVTRARAPEPPADLRPFRAYAGALEDLTRAHAALLLKSSEPGSTATDLAQLRATVSAQHTRLDSLAAATERAERRGVGEVGAALLDLDAFRADLEPGTAVVSYGVERDGVLAIVVRRDRAAWVDLGPSAGLAERVAAWHELASTPGGPADRLGAALHATLLAPLAEHLAGAARLVVVPDGALAYLPIEALVDAAGVRVLEQHEVAYVPSASTYAALRRRAAGRARGTGLVALADPAYPEGGSGVRFPRLPGTRDEVALIAALYAPDESRVLTGAEATLAALESALAASEHRALRAVHLACHGLVDRAHPRLSGLVLAGGEVLSVERLARRPVQADLVVLSACETAGAAWQDGEGLVGLARPLLRTGASRVIVSTWRVPDRSTAALLADVHRRWSQGATPAAALREAKRALVRAGGRSAHPYAWAPFVLWGLPQDP